MNENPWYLPGVINKTSKKAASTYFGYKAPVFSGSIATQIKAAAQSGMAGGPTKTEIKKERDWGAIERGGRLIRESNPRSKSREVYGRGF